MICTDKSCFSPETIKRLAVYLQNFKRLKQDHIETISSEQISKLLHVSPEQFRRDLSYFGEFGKRGVGYSTETLVTELESILGLDKQWSVALIGVGKLGCSLLNYKGFSEQNISITAAFDADPSKFGKIVNKVKIQDMRQFKKVIQKQKIRICILSVPVENAQEAADLAVEAGIESFLNFSPVILNVPGNVYVTNMDIYSEIERLIFFLNHP